MTAALTLAAVHPALAQEAEDADTFAAEAFTEDLSAEAETEQEAGFQEYADELTGEEAYAEDDLQDAVIDAEGAEEFTPEEFTEDPAADTDEAEEPAFEEDADDLIEDLAAEEEAEETAYDETIFLGEPGDTGEDTWELTGDTLTISGTSRTASYSSADEVPWAASAGTIKNVVVSDGVTEIGSYIFVGLLNLEKAQIADSVTVIGEKAFDGSTKVVISGSFGKTAESYAAENKIPFVPTEVTDLKDAVLTVKTTAYTYSGSAFTPEVTAVFSKTALKKDTDYTVKYTNNTNAGTATVTITGKGNYKGTKSASFKIDALSLAKASVSGIQTKTYTGSAITQTPTVALGSKTLKAGTDYTVSYKNNVNVGTATVTITGKGNYKDAVNKTFAINKAQITKSCVAKIKSKPYTGKKIKPTPVVTVAGRTLKKGTDFTVKYKNNKKIGKAKVTITGKGSYKGKVTVTFKIRKASIADAKIKGIKDRTYNGSAQKPVPVVKLAKKKLKAGKDYKVSYKDNVDAGTATVTIRGKGNYKGKVVRTFTIDPARIRDASVTEIKDKAYTGKAVKQEPVVKVGGRTLKEGTDYRISYENNIKIGTAKMKITGKGNYTGSLTKTFKIDILSIAKAEITGVEDLTYSGSAVIQEKITVKLDGEELKAGKDYRVAYAKNTAIGTAKIVITGIGSYKDTVSKEFDVLPRGTEIAAMTLNPVRTQARLTVKWRNIGSQADGYRVQYSTDRYFNTINRTQDVNEDSRYPVTQYIFITNDPNGTYYARICTWKTVNGKKYYSKWSKNIVSNR